MKCHIGGSSPGTVLFAKFRETYIVLYLKPWPVSPRSIEGAILTKMYQVDYIEWFIVLKG